MFLCATRVGSRSNTGAVHLLIVHRRWIVHAINAVLLLCALSGAIFQNLLAGHDLQLAILYTLVVVTLVFMCGGKFSLDEWMMSKGEQKL
jgi:hypothetical protein